MSRRSAVFMRVAAIIIVAAGGFVVFQNGARHLEAEGAAGLFRLAGDERIRVAGPSSIEVLPSAHAPFRAVVTPSCSSIGSLVALVCLGALVPGGRRRNFAVAVAVCTVAGGNIIRIGASLGIGLIAGRQSLILFHDWVGSIFGFAYTLGGYLLLLHLLLPARPRLEAVAVA
jgi:carbamoyl-phosphate synthase large subunit